MQQKVMNYRLSFCFISYQPPYGLKNFWVLISILLDEDKVQLPLDYTKGIMHTQHAVKYKVVSYAHILDSCSRYSIWNCFSFLENLTL